MKEVRTYYSRDEELFQHDDLDELLREMDDDECLIEGATYLSANFEPLKIDDLFKEWDVHRLLENIDEKAWDFVGGDDDVNVCSDIGTDKAKELHSIILDWLKKNVNTPRYWCVIANTMETHTVTAEQIEKARGRGWLTLT